MKRKQKKAGRVLLLIFGILLLAAALYCTGLLYPSGSDEGDSANAGWMAQLDDARPLSLINIPGTHDSGTRYIFPSYIFQDQNTSVTRQLENGYRYLDVRVALNKAGDDLVIIHAFGTCRTGSAVWSAPLTFDSMVADTLAFLDTHPGETVIFCVKPERESDDVNTVRALVEQKVAQAPDRWFTENRIPTLGEVRSRIVLCRRYEDGLGLNFKWAEQKDPTVLDDPIAIEGKDTFTLAVQDRFHYGVADKWVAVQYTLRNTTATENTFCLNFLSTSPGKIPHPRKYAEELNGLFLAESLTAGERYGVILFDFADARLARAVIDTNLIP